MEQATTGRPYVDDVTPLDRGNGFFTPFSGDESEAKSSYFSQLTDNREDPWDALGIQHNGPSTVMDTRSKPPPPPERRSSNNCSIILSIEDQPAIRTSSAVKDNHTKQTRSSSKPNELNDMSPLKPMSTTAKPIQTKPHRGPITKSKKKSQQKIPSPQNKNELARNRIAASKCRVRKKKWIENLQVEKTGVEAIRKELQAQYITLLQEACVLKNHLINHAGCGDPNIDIWISNEASKFARRLIGGK